MYDGVGPTGIDPVLTQNGFHQRFIGIAEIAVGGDVLPFDVELGHVHEDFVYNGEVFGRRYGPVGGQTDQNALHLVAG